MANFKVGQKVVCIKKEAWTNERLNAPPLYPCPKYNETVTIIGIQDDNDEYLILHGYEASFDRIPTFHYSNFRPLADYATDAIPEILKNFSPKEETSDVPCKEVVNQNQQ